MSVPVCMHKSLPSCRPRLQTTSLEPLKSKREWPGRSLKRPWIDTRKKAILPAPWPPPSPTKIMCNIFCRPVLHLSFRFQHVSLSYNGGKDCLVLLIIYLAVLHSHYTRPSSSPQTKKSDSFPQTIPSIYAKPPDPFPSVSSFVDYSSRLYHLDLTHISTNPGPHKKHRSHSNPPLTTPPPKLDPSTTTSHEIPAPTQPKPTISFRDAFALYLDSHPSVRAIFVGTRRTDPHGGHLTHFDPTDHNWPSFMRIHPVIDWHLSEIWCFLRSPCLKDLEDGSPLKYCAMYDQGYTSLGGVNDTLRNPELKYIDANGSEKYRPAHEMTWDEGERLGRE
ncbi:hypothetical protein, variant [Exophiala mesophila]|uniref:FAD synthase n=1 Tax=Exophiala mesophila TaxID=212818 RepID=A0A0D1ZIH8_EXOME|nr:hypothetical protein, variant [Exophiala mesophila]KIV93709.1 hypothetical protein, variant [Exophiala mesophila]